MRKFVQLRNKSLFFLVAGILVLIVGFIFISCGGDPEFKVALPDNGPFAVDLSISPEPTGTKIFSSNINFPSIAGKELTVEAWVQSKTASLIGGIFGRFDAKGIILYMKDNEPKLAIRRAPITLEPMGCTQINATSTECIVGSNDTTTLTDGEWHHIAGVLVYADHTATHDPCGGAEAQTPHMDIYINGVFQNCSTTGSLFADSPDPENRLISMGTIHEGGAPSLDNGEVMASTHFDGAIDEVRIWVTARTAAQIQSCMGQELSLTVKGDCYIDTAILKGYWRFNEGEGVVSADYSGGGGSAGIESPSGEFYDGAWTAPGAPITRDPDSD